MNKCCGCDQESDEELTKVRIDYPDGEDWEGYEFCDQCMQKVVIPFNQT